MILYKVPPRQVSIYKPACFSTFIALKLSDISQFIWGGGIVCVDHGLAKFFSKRPDSKYFRLAGLGSNKTLSVDTRI